MENRYEKEFIDTSTRLTDLIRDHEETLRVREEIGERPLIRHYEKDGKHVVVLGIPHSLRIEDMTAYKDLLREKYPDIFLSGLDMVMLEGSPVIVAEDFSEEIIKKYGEQAYLASVAKNQGVEVHYWDMTIEEKIKTALEKGYSVEDIFGWLMGAAGKILLENGERIDESSLREIFSRYVSDGFVERVQTSSGVDIDPQHVDFEGLSEKYFQKKLSEMSLEDAARISDPYESQTTNKMIRDLNTIRDKQAIAQLEKVKESHNVVFICAGLDHAIAWDPAIEALYS